MAERRPLIINAGQIEEMPSGDQIPGAVSPIPAGGTTDQVLKKVDGTDYNFAWSDEAGGGGGTTSISYAPDSKRATLTLSGSTSWTIPDNVTKVKFWCVNYNPDTNGTVTISMGAQTFDGTVENHHSSSIDGAVFSATARIHNDVFVATNNITFAGEIIKPRSATDHTLAEVWSFETGDDSSRGTRTVATSATDNTTLNFDVSAGDHTGTVYIEYWEDANEDAAALPFARFTPPTSGMFSTAIGAGTMVTNAYDATTKRYVMRKNTADMNAQFENVTGGTDFTRIFKIAHHKSSVDSNISGIAVRNSTTNDMIVIGALGSSHSLYRQYWNNTTFSSEATLTDASGAHDLGLADAGTYYLKFVRSGNDLDVYASKDGLLWSNSVFSDDIVTGELQGDLDLIGPFINSTVANLSALEVIGYDTAQQPPAVSIGPRGDTGPVATMVQSEISGTTHTVDNTDLAGNVIRRMNNASATVITVAPSLTGNEPATFIQVGAGVVSFAAGVGVTINSADGNLAIAARYGSATLIPDSTTADTYYLVGHLSA